MERSSPGLPMPRLSPMKVGIIGLGYVGLPLAVAFAEAGDEVVGVDVDQRASTRSPPARAGSRTSATTASPRSATASKRPPATTAWAPVTQC